MKKLTLVILTLSAMFLGTNGFAQGKYGADSAKCVTNLSFYKEYFKQKNYDEALPSWRQAYHFCPPTANQTMLIDGTTLLRHLIQKNARNAAYAARDPCPQLSQQRPDHLQQHGSGPAQLRQGQQPPAL